ncbi:MAG: L-fucose mutarotase [Verrucomicrobiota bacterium]|jgi:L-fucose mutarotase
MLKGISPLLSPEMLKVLMEMGHGDELVIADGNFPSASHGRRVLRCDGHGVSEVLDAVLQLFPLDTYSKHPVALMEVVPGDDCQPVIWGEFERVVERRERRVAFEWVERFAFYERARRAYAVFATSDKALYANILLKKGVI